MKLAQSAEFIRKTADDLNHFIRGLGTDDVLMGGAGNDQLTGGLYSDTFVFSALETGTMKVLDLERWDTLRFDNFGYDDAQDVRDHLSISGGHLVFSDQGVTVVLGASSLTLHDDMILIT